MEALIVIAVLLVLAYWAFRAGKREGSTKGYRVGRQHERRRRARRHRFGKR
jgi:hypothetical protein